MPKTLYVTKTDHHPSIEEGTLGQVEFKIRAFQQGDPAFQKPEGEGPLGMSLAQLRTLFGGEEGAIVDPFLGQTHLVSLAPWAELDPDQTYLHFAFKFIPAA